MRDLIRSRRSIRRYRAEAVPRDVIESLLDVAIWAPSAHNRQPWRFVVIQDDAQKAALASAMAARLRADLSADQVPAEIIEKDTARSYARITGAPVVIVVCMTLRDMDTYPDARRSHNETLMAVQSVAMAGQNLLLAAHDAGLAACWMCAPLFCPDTVQEALELADDWQPQGMVTLGYAAETRQKDRYPLAQVVLWR